LGAKSPDAKMTSTFKRARSAASREAVVSLFERKAVRLRRSGRQRNPTRAVPA
jgi:hypothetical protein